MFVGLAICASIGSRRNLTGRETNPTVPGDDVLFAEFVPLHVWPASLADVPGIDLGWPPAPWTVPPKNLSA
jgi:hypothetical protein